MTRPINPFGKGNQNDKKPNQKVVFRAAPHRRQQGFTLLLAVLVASIFLAVAATVSVATSKNIIFSTSGRESQFAFYAADSGIECALYWDKIGYLSADGKNHVTAFPAGGLGDDSTPDPVFGDAPGNISCGPSGSITPGAASGIYASQNFISRGNKTATSIFTLSLNHVTKSCAIVLVTKSVATASDGSNSTSTTIDSYGYNTCDTTNLRRIERALEAKYTTY